MITLARTPEYKIRHVIERYPFDSVDKIAKDARMGTATITLIIKRYGLKKKTRPIGKKIEWTPEMLDYLTRNFKSTDNETLAFELNVSPRSMSRKAQELGLTKSKQYLRRVVNEAGAASKYFLKKSGRKFWNDPEEIKRFAEAGKAYRFGSPGDPRKKKKKKTAKVNTSIIK